MMMIKHHSCVACHHLLICIRAIRPWMDLWVRNCLIARSFAIPPLSAAILNGAMRTPFLGTCNACESCMLRPLHPWGSFSVPFQHRNGDWCQQGRGIKETWSRLSEAKRLGQNKLGVLHKVNAISPRLPWLNRSSLLHKSIDESPQAEGHREE